MSRKIKNFISLYVVFLGLFILNADRIVLIREGSYKNVKIRKESFSQIHYQYKIRGAQPQKLNMSTVREISREKAPLSFVNAEREIQYGLYSQAIKSYKMLLRKRDWKQHCYFKLGICYQRWAETKRGRGRKKRYKRAIKMFQKLIQQKSLYSPEASLELARCYFSLQDWYKSYRAFFKAYPLYKEMINRKFPLLIYKVQTGKNKYFTIFQRKDAKSILEEIKYFQGLCLENLKKYSGAITKYKSVSQNWKKKAELRIACCLFKQEKSLPAKSAFLKLLKKVSADEKQILGEIYLGLGHIYYQKDQIKNALFCYLRVKLLYRADRKSLRLAQSRIERCMQLIKNQKSFGK